MKKRCNPELIYEMSQARMAPVVTKQPECLLEAMELISESANNTHLNDNFFKAVELPTNYLSERLHITPMQAILFSLLMDYSDDTNIRLSDVAELTGCSTIKLLRFSKALEGLAEKHYVKIKNRSSQETYRIPREVINALRDDKPYEYTLPKLTNVSEFFDQYERLLEERQGNEVTYSMFRKLNEENLEQIKDTHFAKSLYRDIPDSEERLIFVHIANLYVGTLEDTITLYHLRELFDDYEIPGQLKRDLEAGSTIMQRKLIENANVDGMVQSNSFSLTDYAKNDVLSEISLKSSHHPTHHLTKHDSLPEKTLIYNANEQEQIGQLASLLMPGRFTEIQENLEGAGIRRGLCCLFYGAPGTGKTETVYQIARMTGRDIMQVNVDQIKSCWVGESEKNIKHVFDRYAKISRESEVVPILLFNEADAILGLRMEGAIRGVDKMENSIQNIILQEMESMPGIMIATTNLTSNLDRAFERRFLYKIKFDKPTEEARCKIWMQMLKGLSLTDARYLASRFDFSGGEIENIVRKHSISAILSGSALLDIKMLAKICEQERIQSSGRRKVGF